ncbi:hypothetical protein GJ496_001666 [Pomphorhynchus laevis]|nr:hypothetical protein GJ496_001666 [Pomphorhynchus laevis]
MPNRVRSGDYGCHSHQNGGIDLPYHIAPCYLSYCTDTPYFSLHPRASILIDHQQDAMRGPIIFCILIVMVFAGRDFYKILGLSRQATRNEITRAFRKLAVKYHPDSNPNEPDAQQKFQEISEAYEILHNKEKKASYDKYGEEGLKQDAQHHHFNNFDSIRSMFGSFFGFPSSGEERAEVRGGNVVIDLFVTLNEVYEGEFVEIIRNKPVKKKTSGTRQCNCRTEMKATSLGGGQYTMMQHKICETCPNVKYVTEEQLLDIEIEIGVEDNHVYTFKGEGEPHIDGEAGDLQFIIRIENHFLFKRIGNNLYSNVTISLEDALVGFKFNITHLDGHKVLVDRNCITKPGEVHVLRGEGMPDYLNSDNKGHLYITFDINFPTVTFTEDQKTKIRQLIGKTSLAREQQSINI